MTTLKQVVAEARANDPEAKLAYHSMFEIPSKNTDAWGVKQEHEVFWIPAFSNDVDGGTEPVNHAGDFGWETSGQYLRGLA
eukprot:11216073-Lingulodinium_polyedra.AAC.1